MSFCHKLRFVKPNISATGWCKTLIFQTQIMWSTRIHSLKYLRSTTLGCKVRKILVCGKDSIPMFGFALWKPWKTLQGYICCITRAGSTLHLFIQTGQYEWMYIEYTFVPAWIRELLEWGSLYLSKPKGGGLNLQIVYPWFNLSHSYFDLFFSRTSVFCINFL